MSNYYIEIYLHKVIKTSFFLSNVQATMCHKIYVSCACGHTFESYYHYYGKDIRIFSIKFSIKVDFCSICKHKFPLNPKVNLCLGYTSVDHKVYQIYTCLNEFVASRSPPKRNAI